MTKVVFTRDTDGLIAAVDLRGHAGFAGEGEDIVCAAVTSAIQLTHIHLDDVLGLVFDTVAEQDTTHIRLDFPPDAREAAQDSLTALLIHYTEMQENYAEFITVTEVHSDAEN